MSIQLLRLPAVLALTGSSRTRIYEKIQEGLFVSPIKIGRRASAWPSNEVDALINAWIAGQSDDEIRALVAHIHIQRAA